MRKLINLFLITVITAVMVIVSCADKEDNNLSQTGLLDANGNIISGTLIETNVVWVTNNIDVWITKGGVHKIISNRDGSVKVEYKTNVLSPNLPTKATDLYRIHVPFAGKGDGYYTVIIEIRQDLINYGSTKSTEWALMTEKYLRLEIELIIEMLIISKIRITEGRIIIILPITETYITRAETKIIKRARL